MKYLKIQNNGELDIRLVALMGGTTKRNNHFKIGQFGTGLKYTLAYLVRNNIDFHIFSGDKKIDIQIEKETISDIEFNIICIKGNRTSITDQMGFEWKAWMIVRELWCNALDEGGEFRGQTESLTGESGKTTFYLQITPEIKEVIDNWNNYFIHDVQPISSDQYHAIYPGGENGRIYKNGVLIKEYVGSKSLFSYDYKLAPINELREFIGSRSSAIVECLKNPSTECVQYFLENITEDYYEGNKSMDYNWYVSFGNNWKKAIGNAKLIHPEAVKTIKQKSLDVDLSGTITVPEGVYKFLTGQFEGIGALRVAGKVNEFYETYSSESDEKIKQALVVLEEAGYNFSPELKFVFGVFGNKQVWAKVDMDAKEVFISENIADKSLFDVCTTLIEENEHYKTGLDDCTREFQQHFINLYTNQIFKNAKISL